VSLSDSSDDRENPKSKLPTSKCVIVVLDSQAIAPAHWADAHTLGGANSSIDGLVESSSTAGRWYTKLTKRKNLQRPHRRQI